MKKSNVIQVVGAYLISGGPNRSQGGPYPRRPPPPDGATGLIATHIIFLLQILCDHRAR